MATESILPNSEPRILRPLAGKHGTFQVHWIAEIDAHVLTLNGSSAVASHHNGYSVHNLAERIVAAWNGAVEPDYVVRQAEYITRCGGMCRNLDHVRNIASQS